MAIQTAEIIHLNLSMGKPQQSFVITCLAQIILLCCNYLQLSKNEIISNRNGKYSLSGFSF